VQHILVVEDMSEIREMMRLALEEDSDYRVSVAPTLQAARTLLDDLRPDLLILDAVVPNAAGFPGRSGMEFAAYALAREVPIIVMTGHADLADMLEELRFPLLRKPFGIDELRRAARAATRAKRENLRRVRGALDYLLHNRAEFAELLERLGRLGEEIERGNGDRPRQPPDGES
jgi:DNA-binding response OmpR family regulator